MSLVLRAALVSLAAHALFLALLGWLPGQSPPEDGPRLPPGDFTLVLVNDDLPGGSEPQELVIPVLVEPPTTPALTTQPGPTVLPPNPGLAGQGGPATAPPAPGTAGRAPRTHLSPARSVVFLIDRSISMGLSGTLTPAKDELRALLESLPATTHFQVIAYSRLAEPLVLRGGQRLVPADPDTVQQALARVEPLAPEGGTEHLRALKRGLLLRPDSLVLLTDGLALPDGAVEEITALNQGRTALHVVELTRSRQVEGSPMATRLTERNRGTSQRLLVP